MGKRGQMTLILMIAIVLITIIIATLYFVSKRTEQASADSREVIAEDLMQVAAVREYVTACVDMSTKQGLMLLGEQGGVIYTYQANGTSWGYGLVPGKDFVPFLSTTFFPGVIMNVSYGIKKPLHRDLFHPAPPQYPYPRPYMFLDDKPDNLLNAFGNAGQRGSRQTRSNLRSLCNSAKSSNYLFNDRTGFVCTSGENSSQTIQTYLERYVVNKTIECLNFSLFEDLLGYDIDEGNISSEVLFGESDVMSTVFFPVEIGLRGTSEYTPIHFSSNPQVRFKKLYEFANAIIEHDVESIFFNLTTDISEISTCTTNYGTQGVVCQREGMDVMIHRNVCYMSDPYFCDVSSANNDVLLITDTKSNLNGRPFVFQFAIESRVPALDYVNESKDKALYQKTNLNTLPSEPFDILVDVGDTIEIQPLATDPDDEAIVFYYAGWRSPYPIVNPENDDEYCDLFVLDPAKKPDRCVNGGELYNSWEQWEESFVVPFERTKGYSQYYNPITMQSELIDADRGHHVVRLIAKDEGDSRNPDDLVHSDWQDIHIVVNDLPSDHTTLQIGGYGAPCLDATAGVNVHSSEIFTLQASFQCDDWYVPPWSFVWTLENVRTGELGSYRDPDPSRGDPLDKFMTCESTRPVFLNSDFGMTLQPGERYVLSLTVIDGFGAQGTQTQDFRVCNPPPPP